MGPAICRSLKFLIDQAAFDEHLATFVSCRLESLGSSDVGHHLSWNNVVAAFRRRKLAVIGMGGSSSRVIPPRGGQRRQGLAADACGSVTDSGAIESRAMAPCRVASAGEPRS
jgi:hypothetical protein